jgi:hypothetical protein
MPRRRDWARRTWGPSPCDRPMRQAQATGPCDGPMRRAHATEASSVRHGSETRYNAERYIPTRSVEMGIVHPDRNDRGDSTTRHPSTIRFTQPCPNVEWS